MTDAIAATKQYMKADDLIHEYNHFRLFGFTDTQIAERLGMNLTQMVARLVKAGVELASAETHLALSLERAISSGAEFTEDAFPDWSLPGQARTMILQASKQKRIVKVGKRNTVMSKLTHGRPVNVWKAAA